LIICFKGDGKDVGVAKAYESVLLLTIRQPNSAEFKVFASEVKVRANRDYGYDFQDEAVLPYILWFFLSFKSQQIIKK